MPTTEAESPTPNNLSVNHETKTELNLLHHSQQPPIHSLPPEVLHLVFLRFTGYYMYRRRLRFRLVCKYWAEVINSTPELWTLVSVGFHPELQAMIVRNSGNRLLEVDYDETWWEEDPGNKDRLAAFSRLIEPSASRWRTLAYHRMEDSESGTWPLSLPLHSLERIEIDGSTRNAQRPTLDAPKLSHVDVRLPSVNLRSLCSLQSLRLKATNSTLDELVTILRASPGLHTLSLTKTLLENGTEGLPSSYTTKIRLPRLCYLHISGPLAESSSFLLNSIEAPSLEMFNAKVTHPNDAADLTHICEAVSLYLGAFPLPKDQKPQVRIAANSWDMWLSIGNRTINIRHPMGPEADGAQGMPAYIASAMKHLDSRTCEEVTTLDIWCPEDITRECLCVIHSRFPRIQQLIVTDGLGAVGTRVRSVVQHLSLPSGLGAGEEWLLPKLTRLQLGVSGSNNRDIVNMIVELVGRRKEAEQTGEITELEIRIGIGKLDASAVETLSQSITKFDLVEA
ncbi:hypothetical protein FRC00_007308 [Tulasnella sp. 408]|nr:hypothetical protein FRC00_007308 [Tulasnella sp. 408]